MSKRSIDIKTGTTNRAQLASMYRVTPRIFNSWIELNAELKKIFKPYLDQNKKTLPPEIKKKVIEVLGDPPE